MVGGWVGGMGAVRHALSSMVWGGGGSWAAWVGCVVVSGGGEFSAHSNARANHVETRSGEERVPREVSFVKECPVECQHGKGGKKVVRL